MVADSLTLLSPLGDSFAHAYVRLDIHEKWVHVAPLGGAGDSCQVVFGYVFT